jgi:hypothetical protein
VVEHHLQVHITLRLLAGILIGTIWNNLIHHPILIIDHMNRNVLHAVETGFSILHALIPSQFGKLFNKTPADSRRVSVQFLDSEHSNPSTFTGETCQSRVVVVCSCILANSWLSRVCIWYSNLLTCRLEGLTVFFQMDVWTLLNNLLTVACAGKSTEVRSSCMTGSAVWGVVLLHQVEI